MLQENFNFVTAYGAYTENSEIVFNAKWDGYHQYEVTWWKDGKKGFFYYPPSIVGQNIKNGHWKIVNVGKQESAPAEPLLQKLKQFTVDTNASVWINSGTYEVYYNATDNPAKCASDEDLSKLVEAIAVLDKAVYGKK